MINFEDVIPLILLFGVLSAVLFMNQRRTKKQETIQESLVEGDELVLHSGIHGFVASIDANVIWLEIAPDTEIKVSKAAIQTVLSGTD